MKKIFLLLLINLSLYAELLKFDQINTSILSKKDNSYTNVELSLVLKGRDIKDQKIELMDVLQTVIGSFWAEVLITAKGKEQFKKMIINLADKQYGVEVDFVYIQNIRIVTDPLEECRELLKSR
jgi:flagellar basal body-associated protein FliL